MDWREVYDQSRRWRWRGALFRIGMVSLIVLFILGGAAVITWNQAAVRWIMLGIMTPFCALVWGAFAREAWRNATRDPLVVRGRVSQRGMALGQDSGGMSADIATRLYLSPEVVLEVEEAFTIGPDGSRTERPDQLGQTRIQQLRWYRALQVGEQVTLVCLPMSTDPVLRVPQDGDAG